LKIPKSLKIGGRSYKVLYPHIFTDSCQNLYGQHDSSGQTIKMADKDTFGVVRHPESIAHTFMHEILHAVDNVYVGGKIQSLDCCEHIIDQLAEGLCQVLKDNKLDFSK